MKAAQRRAGLLVVFVLTWLVGTTAGVLWFVPRTETRMDRVPDPPTVAATPSRAVASYPGCVESARWPKGRAADWVIVAWPDGKVAPMRFGDAWTRGTNRTHADDVWVIGVCYTNQEGK